MHVDTIDKGSEFTAPAINVSVLYKADGTPAQVVVYAQVYYFNNKIIILLCGIIGEA